MSAGVHRLTGWWTGPRAGRSTTSVPGADLVSSHDGNRNRHGEAERRSGEPDPDAGAAGAAASSWSAPGPGRPRRFCRDGCRQQAYLARKLASSHGLGDDDVIVFGWPWRISRAGCTASRPPWRTSTGIWPDRPSPTTWPRPWAGSARTPSHWPRPGSSPAPPRRDAAPSTQLPRGGRDSAPPGWPRPTRFWPTWRTPGGARRQPERELVRGSGQPKGWRLLPDDPHAEVLAVGAVGHGQGGLGPVDLVLAGGAAHLVGGLGEAEQARGADRVARQHAARAVDRERARRARSSPSSIIFQPSPGSAMPWASSQIASCHENGTYSSAMSICSRGLVMPACS